jgi:molecular chaperone GrpE
MIDEEQIDQEMNEQEDQLEGVSEKENMEDGPTESSDSTNGEGGENTLEQEIAELKNKYLRLYSDFENFRKRTSKERLDLISTASEEVLRDLIPVVDDFERALKASENEKDASKVGEGNHLIFQKLVRILKSKGLVPMDDLIGKPFDADTQEAITQIPAPTKELKGKVVDVVEKGYTLGDKVVRFAKVVIGA